MAVVFSNNATTVLSSNITNSATSIAVQDGSVFPTLSGTDYFYATLQDPGNTKREIVKVTARSGNTLTVTRAVDGSSASAFSANDAFELRLNAAALNDAVNSGTADLELNSFTGDGSEVDFTLSMEALEANTLVYIDGVYQNKTAYSISGYVLTFSAAPDNGAAIEVTTATVAPIQESTDFLLNQFTGDGSDTTFSLSSSPEENQTTVFISGVYQSKSNYSISGTTLTFSTAPPASSSIEVMVARTVVYGIGTPSNDTVSTAKIVDGAVTPAKLSLTYATETYVGTAVSNLVDSSPAALDTLNELAAALGDDPNFATTVTNSIALKAPLASPSFTGNVDTSGLLKVGTNDTEYANNYLRFKPAGAAYIDHNTVGQAINFRLSNASSLDKTVMTLTSAGNVNIGTSSSSAKLTVGTFGDTARAAQFHGGSILVDGGAATDLIMGDGNVAYMSLQTTDNATAMKIRDHSGNSDLVTVERASGNLLVGTTTSLGNSGTTIDSSGYIYASNDNAALYLNRQGVDGIIAEFRKGGTAVGSIGTYSGDLTIGNGSTVGLIFEQTGSDRISPWNLTTNATRDGEIDLGDSNQRFKDLYLSGEVIAGAGANNNPSITSHVDTDTGLFFGGGNILGFSTGGGERMRIDASGNLLVGKTTTAVTTGCDMRPTGNIVASASADNPLYLNRSTNDGDIAVFAKDGAAVGSIGTISSLMTIGTGTTGLIFDSAQIYPWNMTTNSATDASKDLGAAGARFKDLYLSGTLNGISTTKSASGNRWGILPEVESNGVMEIGRYIDFHSSDGDTSDYGARLDFDGTNIVSTNAFSMASGIYLGGTGAANKLDDYEEGTFTPTFVNIGNGSYLVQNGRYTKIGNQCTCYIYLSISVFGTASGSIVVGGLPFNALSVAGVYGSTSAVHGTGWTTPTAGLQGLIAAGQTTITFYENMATTSSPSAYLTNMADIGTGNLLFSITYTTA